MTVDPKVMAAIDQATKLLIEVVPRLLKQFYDELKKEGFTDPQAMQLTVKMVDNFKPGAA